MVWCSGYVRCGEVHMEWSGEVRMEWSGEVWDRERGWEG